MKTILAFGLDFALPVYSVDFYSYFLGFEKLVHAVKDKCNSESVFKDFLRETRNLALRYFYNFKPYKVFSAIVTKNDIKLLRDFSKNREIVVCKPDKGNGVVIVSRKEYVRSMEDILSDKSKFQVIESSISKFSRQIEDKINSFLRKIKPNISEDLYKSVFATGTGPGTLYGTAKIHKPDFSTKFQFRPIFASYNTPSYKLSKFLVPYLNHLTKNQFTLENSYAFSDEIKKLKNCGNCTMASFDIESLFSNVPLEETIDICVDRIYKDTTNFLGLGMQNFRKLLSLAVQNTFFIFNSSFYRQLDGLGMGLPLGPTFANIFLCTHEEKWLKDCPNSFTPVFYRRYVDDTFLLFKHPDHIPKFLDFLNSRHPNINFTFDLEKNRRINFLDCTIEKTDNSFLTSVFRRETFTGLGLSYFSYVFPSFKFNAISSLLHRGFKISSTYFLMHKEFEFLKVFFFNNGYPIFLINRIIRKFLDEKFSDFEKPESNTEIIYSILPYFGPQSLKLKKELLAVFRKYIPNYEIKLIFINRYTIGSFFNYKDKIPTCLRSSLVYEYSCAQCASRYVGSTCRNLYQRVAEHVGVSYRTNHPLSNPSQSAIRKHTEKCGNSIELENFKILSNSQNLLDLRILESLHIFRLKPALNNMDSAFSLSLVK